MASHRVERVIDEPDFEPVRVLDRDNRAPWSVALVLRADGGKGTGFLLSGDLLMTNAHVLRDKSEAADGAARFGFWIGPDGSAEKGEEFALDPGRYFVANERLDYAIVALDGTPSSTYEPLILNADTSVTAGDDVFVIGHPSGRPMEVVARDNEVLKVDAPYFHYRADTEKVSSGSPVFNSTWSLVGIHHYEPRRTDSADGNEGVLISAIARDWQPVP